MGSGKSTVGPLLAARLGWKFIDVDDVIEAEAGAPSPKSSPATAKPPSATANMPPSPASLAATRWFWPSAAAQSNAPTPATCCSIRPATLLVHLEVELATTLARCRGHRAHRPILADQANLASRYATPPAALPHRARLDRRGRTHSRQSRGCDSRGRRRSRIDADRAWNHSTLVIINTGTHALRRCISPFASIAST